MKDSNLGEIASGLLKDILKDEKVSEVVFMYIKIFEEEHAHACVPENYVEYFYHYYFDLDDDLEVVKVNLNDIGKLDDIQQSLVVSRFVSGIPYDLKSKILDQSKRIYDTWFTNLNNKCKNI